MPWNHMHPTSTRMTQVATCVPVRWDGSSRQFWTAMAMLPARRARNRATKRYFHKPRASWSGVRPIRNSQVSVNGLDIGGLPRMSCDPYCRGTCPWRREANGYRFDRRALGRDRADDGGVRVAARLKGRDTRLRLQGGNCGEEATGRLRIKQKRVERALGGLLQIADGAAQAHVLRLQRRENPRRDGFARALQERNRVEVKGRADSARLGHLSPPNARAGRSRSRRLPHERHAAAERLQPHGSR